MSIARKPVASSTLAPIAPVAPATAYIESQSDSDLSKDLEKSTYGGETRRVSTYIDEPLPARPVPAYTKFFAGFAGRRPGGYGQKKYFGLSKKIFFACVAVLVIFILALAIGLGVGLSKGKKHQNLPLPNNREVHTGDLTYYAPALGACGIVSSDTENIVAVSHLVFDAVQVGGNPNNNVLCGKKLRASRWNEEAGEQRSVDLTVVDRCTGCEPTDIDTTTTVFDQMAPHDRGRVVTTWAWLDVDL